MADKRALAKAALDTHDALKAAHEREPAINPATDLPYDTQAWLDWHANQSKPAYEEWSAAMDALYAELGTPDASRHPWNFRPLCERIIAGEE